MHPWNVMCIPHSLLAVYIQQQRDRDLTLDLLGNIACFVFFIPDLAAQVHRQHVCSGFDFGIHHQGQEILGK